MLTGKDIDELYQHAYKEARNDNPIGSVVALTWEALAQKINDAHLAPLQAMVRDLAVLLDDKDLYIEDSPDGWWTKREESLVQARQLIGEGKP